VVQKAVPVVIRAIGNVQAYNMVAVKSMVSGEISRVHFTEGQDVKKGELLFTIDPRSFEAVLKQTEANLARDIAQVGQVEADLAKNMALVKQAEANLERDRAQQKMQIEAKRYETLIEKQVVSRQQYDQFPTNAEALEATVRSGRAAKDSAEAAVRSSRAALESAKAAVRADQAAVDNAKVQLSYCFIRSPMDGRTGNLLVQRGNVVKANDLSLVTIHQINQSMLLFCSRAESARNQRVYVRRSAQGWRRSSRRYKRR
jgi:multidrug efflux system membrane fusion protein